MRKFEFVSAISVVQREHKKFELSADQESAWFDIFEKLTIDQWRAVIQKVLTTARFEPKLVDFYAARSAVVGNTKHSDEPTSEEKKQYERALMQRGIVKKTDGRTSWYERASKMDVVLEVMGHEWVNRNLGLKTAKDAFKLAAAMAVKTDRATVERYNSWLDKAYEAAMEKQRGA